MLLFYKEISQKGLDGGSYREESREINHNVKRTRLKMREIKKKFDNLIDMSYLIGRFPGKQSCTEEEGGQNASGWGI